MKKISTNNILIRFFYFVCMLFPVFLYFIFKALFNWHFSFSIGFVFIISVWFILFLVVLYFNVFDWDLFVSEGAIILKQMSSIKVRLLNNDFEIKPLIVVTALFSVYKIKFGNGESYIFKTMPVSNMPFVDSYKINANKIKESILKNGEQKMNN